MKQWNQIKKTYIKQEEKNIILPKKVEDYTQENIDNQFKDIEHFKFTFKSFDFEQLYSVVVFASKGTEEEKASQVLSQINRMIDNIVSWENVKVSDLIELENLSEDDFVSFDKEALRPLLTKNFWLVSAIISSIRTIIEGQNKKVEEQKKT